MKKSALLFVGCFMFSATVQAQTTICDFKEGEGTKELRTTQVIYEKKKGSHHLSQYDLELAKGFVAVSHTQFVVNVVLKENGQAISFHGPAENTSAIGGGIRIPGTSNWLRVTCKNSH